MPVPAHPGSKGLHIAFPTQDGQRSKPTPYQKLYISIISGKRKHVVDHLSVVGLKLRSS